MAKRSRSGKSLPDPQEALRERRKLSARDLIELIHLVNPTGKAMPKSEVEFNYSIKAGLQSLLIEQHKEQLQVIATKDDGVVSLRHQTLGMDACHVPLAALETEARSWVQWQIDMEQQSNQDVGARGSSLVSQPISVSKGRSLSLLQKAEVALSEYDFEGAQEILVNARRQSPNDARPILRLLELFVDTLGLDSEAFALAAGLPDALLEVEQIRSHLALAAARLGKVNEAVTWRGGLLGLPLASVDVALAKDALVSGDLLKASHYFASAQKAWATHPDLLDLEVRLDRANSLAVSHLVDQLEKGNQPAADLAALAQNILSLHPNNHKARQFIKAAALHSQAQAEEDVTTLLQQSLRDGQSDVLRIAISRAQRLGLSKETLLPFESGLATLLSFQQVQSLSDNVEQTITELSSGLANGGMAQGLRLYGRLAPEGRALVKKAYFAEEITWIDSMISSQVGESRLDRIVESVVAMTLASALVSNQNYAEALSECEPHRTVLVEHKAGRALLDRIAAGLSATHVAHAEANLTAAINALQSGNLSECSARLAQVKKSSLSEGASALFAKTTLEFDMRAARNQQINAAHEALKSERHVDAFRLFEILTKTAVDYETDEQRMIFAQQLNQMAARVRQSWVLMDERDFQCDNVEFGNALSPHLRLFSEEATIVLLDDDKTAVVCDAWGPYVFVRFVDVVRSLVCRILLLKVPNEFRSPEFCVIGGSIWGSNCFGHILQIEITDGLPRMWCVLDSLGPTNGNICGIIVFPESRAIRVNMEDSFGKNRTLVVDMETKRTVRIQENAFTEHIVPGTRPLAVALLSHKEAGRLMNPRGVELVQFILPAGHRTLCVAVHPSEPGFVLLSAPDAGSDLDDESPIYLTVSNHDERGGLRSSINLPALAEMRWSFAIDRKKGGIYAVVHVPESKTFALCVLTLAKGILNIKKTIEAPNGLSLIQSADAGTVVATWMSSTGMRFTVLDENIETLDVDFVGELPLRSLNDHWCQPSFEAHLTDNVSNVRKISSDRPDSDDEKPAWARRWLKKLQGNVAGLLALFECTRKLSISIQEEVLVAAESLAPNSEDVRLARVYFEFRRGVWLGDRVIDAQKGRHKEHLTHLKGIMQFKQEHFDDALATWKTSEPYSLESYSMCGLADLCSLAVAARDSEGSRVSFNDKKMDIAALYGAALVAGDLVSLGNFESALVALDQPWIRIQRELQTCAMLVRLMLLSPPSTGLQTFNRALVLAMFMFEVAREAERKDILGGVRGISPSDIEKLSAATEAWFASFVTAMPPSLSRQP